MKARVKANFFRTHTQAYWPFPPRPQILPIACLAKLAFGWSLRLILYA